jgi:hypothetical protein
VCCLRPLPPLPGEPSTPDPDALLLSFEEWKAQRATAAAAGILDAVKALASGAPVDRPAGAPDAASANATAPAPEDGAYADSSGELAPHFRVPLTDRFNFAALDCSARIHSSHKSARSATSILSAKRDRYMLSPCAAPDQHVVVELCDDVRIDTVQLANFEFFSGVFRDVEVRAAPTLARGQDAWTLVGAWRAKNIRGVQVNCFLMFLAFDYTDKVVCGRVSILHQVSADSSGTCESR